MNHDASAIQHDSMSATQHPPIHHKFITDNNNRLTVTASEIPSPQVHDDTRHNRMKLNIVAK